MTRQETRGRPREVESPVTRKLYLPAKVAIEAQEMAALLGCSQSRLYAAAVESALEEWRWAEMIGLKPEDVRRLAAFLRRIGKTESEVQEWLREKENRA